MSLLGLKFTILYVLVGMAVGILGGFFLDIIKAERWLQSFAAEALKRGQQQSDSGVETKVETAASLALHERHRFAKAEAQEIFGRVWKWVVIGVGVGAALHGVVPDGWIEAHLGEGQWWSVPHRYCLVFPYIQMQRV